MKSKQGVTIAALIIAIIGLSIGFAVFANTLTIRSSADVHPDSSNFRVVFSKNSSTEQAGNEYPIVASTTGTGVTATDGLINNEAQDGPLLSNLSASFTEPGQAVTYNLFVLNTGKYVAYLRDLTMGTKTCEAATTREVNGETENIPASEQATGTLVSQACNGISISVTIGTATLTGSGSLNNQALQANGGFVNASVTIRYAEGSAYVDGPMNVEFGDITFEASSVAGEVATPEEPQNNPSSTDYLVDSNGTILSYLGNETQLEIPSTLPVATLTLVSFDDAACMAQIGSAEECSSMYADAQESVEGLLEMSSDEEIGSFFNTQISMTGATVSVVSIGRRAFKNKGLISVVIPNSITTIGQDAFFGNNLSSVTIGSGITSIDKDSFTSNSNLKSVTINTNQSNVTLHTNSFVYGTELVFNDRTVIFGS